jgi:hypothetical protein
MLKIEEKKYTRILFVDTIFHTTEPSIGYLKNRKNRHLVRRSMKESKIFLCLS